MHTTPFLSMCQGSSTELDMADAMGLISSRGCLPRDVIAAALAAFSHNH